MEGLFLFTLHENQGKRSHGKAANEKIRQFLEEQNWPSKQSNHELNSIMEWVKIIFFRGSIFSRWSRNVCFG